jgi:hypothetical protein
MRFVLSKQGRWVFGVESNRLKLPTARLAMTIGRFGNRIMGTVGTGVTIALTAGSALICHQYLCPVMSHLLRQAYPECSFASASIVLLQQVMMGWAKDSQ